MSESPGGEPQLDELAQRHGFSTSAATALLDALIAGHGRQAQFSHPELGGMGQWSDGGMIMIGDMFNRDLKAKVAALAHDLSTLARNRPAETADRAASNTSSSWPTELGQSSSAGSQNGMRYAVFPATQRLAIERDGAITVYDTGDHRISQVSQQQSDRQSLRFSSQNGVVSVDDLRRVSGG